ncbi:hypothetical protein Tco_0705306 [Tanacetum coccineum]|uniref:Uncharacterized protein n=1 Tax=Tanacetum coccineum TaxID=301880 RepID=A0ABQ4Y476_9ASTR
MMADRRRMTMRTAEDGPCGLSADEDEDDEMDVEIDTRFFLEAEEERQSQFSCYPMITIPEPLPIPAWSDSEVARLLAISSPPASPLSPWSSSPPQIPFPLSHPHLLDAHHPCQQSAPTSIPPLIIPSDVRERERPEVNYTSDGVRLSLWVPGMRGSSSVRYRVGVHTEESYKSMVRRDPMRSHELADEAGTKTVIGGWVNMPI